MKGFQNVKVVNMIAGEDLRGDVYEALTIENDGGVGKVIKGAATGTTLIIGVLAEEPRTDVTTDGLAVPVALIGAGGIGLMKAGGTITAGELVISYAGTTPGRVEGLAAIGNLADDGYAFGIALETAADGDIFPVLWQVVVGPHGA